MLDYTYIFPTLKQNCSMPMTNDKACNNLLYLYSKTFETNLFFVQPTPFPKPLLLYTYTSIRITVVPNIVYLSDGRAP